MPDTSRTQEYPIARYLNTRAAYFPSFSSDGGRMAFITDITGVPQLWQVALSSEWDAVRAVAAGISVWIPSSASPPHPAESSTSRESATPVTQFLVIAVPSCGCTVPNIAEAVSRPGASRRASETEAGS